MTVQQMIWRCSDDDLQRDLASYQRSIVQNQMPEMIPHWQAAVAMIEHEIDQRHLLAQVAAQRWSVALLDQAPF